MYTRTCKQFTLAPIFCVLLLLLLLLSLLLMFCYFFLLGFFPLQAHGININNHPKHKGSESWEKTSAGNWRVFKWKFTLNLKYLVNERVLFACLLLYITIFMHWIPSKRRLIKREDRASKQANKQKGKKGKEKKRQWKSEIEIEMGGEASVLLNKTSNITSCEKTFRFRISNQRWISNRKKKHAYTRFRTVHLHSLTATATALYTGVPLAICY